MEKPSSSCATSVLSWGAFAGLKGKRKDDEKWIARDSLLLWLLTSFSGLGIIHPGIVSLLGGPISPPLGGFSMCSFSLSSLWRTEEGIPGNELGQAEIWWPGIPAGSLVRSPQPLREGHLHHSLATLATETILGDLC